MLSNHMEKLCRFTSLHRGHIVYTIAIFSAIEHGDMNKKNHRFSKN